jgi:hypothetical protein
MSESQLFCSNPNFRRPFLRHHAYRHGVATFGSYSTLGTESFARPSVPELTPAAVDFRATRIDHLDSASRAIMRVSAPQDAKGRLLYNCAERV